MCKHGKFLSYWMEKDTYFGNFCTRLKKKNYKREKIPQNNKLEK